MSEPLKWDEIPLPQRDSNGQFIPDDLREFWMKRVMLQDPRDRRAFAYGVLASAVSCDDWTLEQRKAIVAGLDEALALTKEKTT